MTVKRRRYARKSYRAFFCSSASSRRLPGLRPVSYTHLVYAQDLNAIAAEDLLSAQEAVNAPQASDASQNEEDVSMLNDNRGYRLSVLDAAAGSRFYGLEITEDGGKSWSMLNQDPFTGNTGVSAGISFFNETLGFIALSHSGGLYADLYRTKDGGATFEQVTIPAVEVPLTEEETYQPFDFPGMPYEEDGKLYLKVGQGQDCLLYTSSAVRRRMVWMLPTNLPIFY